MSFIESLYKKQDEIKSKICVLEEDKRRMEALLQERTQEINDPVYILQHPIEYAKKQYALKPMRDKIKSLAASIDVLSQKSENIQRRAERIHGMKLKFAPYKRYFAVALILLIDLILILSFLAITSNAAVITPAASAQVCLETAPEFFRGINSA